MRITLIQPLQGAHFGFSRILLVEPLGLECVGAALEQHGHDVRLIDLRLDDPRTLLSHLASFCPEAVGISCGFSTDVYTTLDAAMKVKDALPRTKVFVGGHHASLVPGDFIFEGSPVDAVVVGEGEPTAPELVEAFQAIEDPGSIPGVVTLSNWEGGFTPRPVPGTMDEIPLPARELAARYRRRYHHAFSAPSACLETSRGCPFDCNFCSVWIFYRRRIRSRSVDRILEDLRRIRSLGLRKVMFTDDIAFLDPEQYEELGKRIRDEKLDMRLSCETRTDIVVRHEELMKLWSEGGLETVFLGVEKVDDSGLDSVRKRLKGGCDINQRAIEISRKHGIYPMTSLIADPTWDEGDFDRLERFVLDLDLPNPAFTVLTPLPGTELWEKMKPLITTDDYGFFDVVHLIVPSRLEPKRFYERFARLYSLADTRTRITPKGVLNLLLMGLRGYAGVASSVIAAVRELRDAEKYFDYPGAMRKPSWLPPGYGSTEWIDRAQGCFERPSVAPSPHGSSRQ